MQPMTLRPVPVLMFESSTRDQFQSVTHKAENGWTMCREEGLTPNGNEIRRRWVMRDNFGKFIDVDTYSSDLMERHGFRVVYADDLAW